MDGDLIVKLKFQIMALEWRLVAGIPEISIDVLKMGTGELFIVTVDIEKQPVAVAVPSTHDQPTTLSKFILVANLLPVCCSLPTHSDPLRLAVGWTICLRHAQVV